VLSVMREVLEAEASQSTLASLATSHLAASEASASVYSVVGCATLPPPYSITTTGPLSAHVSESNVSVIKATSR